MSHWTLECLTVGPLQMNAWLLLDPAAGEAALIDPGDEPEALLARITAAGCRLRWLLATHGHFDHVGAAAAIQARWDLPVRLHPADVFLVENMPEHQALYGLPQSVVPRLDPTLADGQTIALGSGQLTVVAVPGHSPGQVMFVWDGHAVVGDCIFAGSVGRTDLPGGDFSLLEQSIRQSIYALPDSTVLHAGHGPTPPWGGRRSPTPTFRAPDARLTAGLRPSGRRASSVAVQDRRDHVGRGRSLARFMFVPAGGPGEVTPRSGSPRPWPRPARPPPSRAPPSAPSPAWRGA